MAVINAKGRKPIGMCCLHVDYLFITGTPGFLEKFKKVVKGKGKRKGKGKGMGKGKGEGKGWEGEREREREKRGMQDIAVHPLMTMFSIPCQGGGCSHSWGLRVAGAELSMSI
jgi:hypothetical protein